MIRHFLAIITAGALMCEIGGARATMVETYNFSGTLAKGGAVAGQFTLDFATSSITAFDFSTPLGTVDADTQRSSIEVFAPASRPALDFVAVNL